MSLSTWLRTTSSRIAFGALLVALAVLAWTISRAFRSTGLPDAPPIRIASIESITRRTPRPMTDIQSTVDNNVFSPERTAPAAAYRMPGEPDPNAKTVEVQKPVVLGTAVATDGRHFATVEMNGDTHPTLVHIGDKIGPWIVRVIERGKVTFVNTADGSRADVGMRDATSATTRPTFTRPDAEPLQIDEPTPQNQRAAQREMQQQVRQQMRQQIQQQTQRPIRPGRPPTPGT